MLNRVLVSLRKRLMKGAEAMRLNEIVTRYLEANGISKKYFSECNGCDLAVTYKWLNGEIKTLPADKLKKIHSFLNGEYYKSIETVMED